MPHVSRRRRLVHRAELAFIMGVGVVIDAFLVRSFLLPALLVLAGRRILAASDARGRRLAHRLERVPRRGHQSGQAVLGDFDCARVDVRADEIAAAEQCGDS
jgi:hypothetical protein